MDEIRLTPSQEHALESMKNFMQGTDRIFVLQGYAGTGKTTLMRFLIKHLKERNITYRLLSTTGRAAKILSNYTEDGAKTIHSLIYAYKDLNQDLSDIDTTTINVETTGQLYLCFEPAKVDDNTTNCVYIVDESSMISDSVAKQITQAKFGSGRLLKELLEYDQRPCSKFIFVGDPCQLPPIEGGNSPALLSNYFLQEFGMRAQSSTLTQIMRQDDDNDIILASSKVRAQWDSAPENKSFYNKGSRVWGIFQFYNLKGISFHTSIETMMDEYVSNIKTNGYNDSILITNSNACCNKLSQSVREKLGFTGTLQKGDLLMVTQNDTSITGLMNGDMVEVIEIGNRQERTINNANDYRSQLKFISVTVRELFTKKIYTTLLIESVLESNLTNLDIYQQSGLFLDFVVRMKKKNITQKYDKPTFDKMMREDPYLNALRCSYGYAITCHKAQGGEWNRVYIHFNYHNFFMNPTKAEYQWMYTAITRAKKVVNFVKDFFFQ